MDTSKKVNTKKRKKNTGDPGRDPMALPGPTWAVASTGSVAQPRRMMRRTLVSFAPRRPNSRNSPIGCGPQGVESVAMESTHVYWIPIYELLDSCGIEVLLVNARQFHNVPGRKTDMQDCQWLQLLHSCGLLRGSFRPHESITRLRALQRQMANLGGGGVSVRASSSGCSSRWIR